MRDQILTKIANIEKCMPNFMRDSIIKYIR